MIVLTLSLTQSWKIKIKIKIFSIGRVCMGRKRRIAYETAAYIWITSTVLFLGEDEPFGTRSDQLLLS